ncbi:hypothetical protein PUN28_019534 [Cardiocondyla obscurior]|uniref:Uncharacterized protein n=1 Tax=Cardiocondyla obscurior TaxID=286306 RepID=A0AAW2E8Z6_9HYME
MITSGGAPLLLSLRTIVITNGIAEAGRVKRCVGKLLACAVHPVTVLPYIGRCFDPPLDASKSMRRLAKCARDPYSIRGSP